MKIRRIDIGDVQDFWQLQKQLDQESSMMMYEPDERKFELGSAVAAIANLDFVIGAEVNGRLVGYLSAERGSFRRLKQTAYLVIGILQDYQHQGLGQTFFKELEHWALSNQIKRLELTVLVRNAAAIALYQKNGFSIEGVRRCSMQFDSEFVDEFYMSKIFES